MRALGFLTVNTRRKTVTSHKGRIAPKGDLTMYANRKKVRDIALKLRFSDADIEFIDCLVAKTGEQKAAVLHKLLMSKVRAELERIEGAESVPQ